MLKEFKVLQEQKVLMLDYLIHLAQVLIWLVLRDKLDLIMLQLEIQPKYH